MHMHMSVCTASARDSGSDNLAQCMFPEIDSDIPQHCYIRDAKNIFINV